MDGEGARPDVEITFEGTGDGVAGSWAAAGLGAEVDGEDVPHDATSATTTAPLARLRTVLILA